MHVKIGSRLDGFEHWSRLPVKTLHKTPPRQFIDRAYVGVIGEALKVALEVAFVLLGVEGKVVKPLAKCVEIHAPCGSQRLHDILYPGTRGQAIQRLLTDPHQKDE